MAWVGGILRLIFGAIVRLLLGRVASRVVERITGGRKAPLWLEILFTVLRWFGLPLG